MVRFSKGGHPELSKARRRLGLVLRSSPPQSKGEVRAGGRADVRLLCLQRPCGSGFARGLGRRADLDAPARVVVWKSTDDWFVCVLDRVRQIVE